MGSKMGVYENRMKTAIEEPDAGKLHGPGLVRGFLLRDT